MAASELSFEQIHEYFLQKGGIVENRDVVRHFRKFLTDPQCKDDARLKFKSYVNTLATSRVEGDQKILTLRPKYSTDTLPQFPSSPKYDSRNAIGLPMTPTTPSSPSRAPPPYRPPPPVTASPTQSYDNISLCSSNLSISDPLTPQAPPRRRMSDKLKYNPQEIDANATQEKENDVPDNTDKQTVSVKERTQKFNRLASVEDGNPSPKQNKQVKKKMSDPGADEDDGALVTSMEPKRCAAWYVAAAKADYHELAKLAKMFPKLVKLKDPYTAYTVLHWGSKHGNVEIIKLFAGTYKADVNARTNGGYVPLHLAAQFGHDDVYEILVGTYNADCQIRDFSGRKPEQYKSSHVQQRPKIINSEYRPQTPKHGRTKHASFLRKSFSPAQRQFKSIHPVDYLQPLNNREIKGRKNKYGDKELGFLRIGSLNVRVKKTTEAFSSFLGVGSGSMSSIDPISEKVHKGWGSADNVTQELSMPAPKGFSSKRKGKRPLEQIRTHSNPGTPNQPQRMIQRNSLQDSDSDTAAGFDSHWKN